VGFGWKEKIILLTNSLIVINAPTSRKSLWIFPENGTI